MKGLNKIIRFEIKQWRIRRVIRLEKSNQRTMDRLDLDYDDVNLRQAQKLETEEIQAWLENNWIH